MQTNGTVYLYIAQIPETPEYRKVLPKERQAILDATRDERIRAQRYIAWTTLLAGLKHSFGLDAQRAELSKTKSGKWVSAVCGISISHCRTAVAAAVSDRETGVDIEPVEDARYREALLSRIAAEEEQKLFSKLPVGQRIAVLWTRKEAAFKRDSRNLHTPIDANAASRDIQTIRITIGDREYAVSSAAKNGTLRVFEVRGEEIAARGDYELILPSRQYSVYILRCAGDRLYTGITTDPDRRRSEHGGSKRSAKFTRAFRPETIAALWETDSRSHALQLEARIKKLTRRQKDALIAENSFALFGNTIDAAVYRRVR